MLPFRYPGPTMASHALLNIGKGSGIAITGRQSITCELLHHPLGSLLPQGHAPHLAWTLTLHPPTIPRGFSDNEQRLWILSMGPFHASMGSSPSPGSDTRVLCHATETDCLPSNSLFQQELKPCSDAIFIAVYLKKQVDTENSYVQSKKKKKSYEIFPLAGKNKWEWSD